MVNSNHLGGYCCQPLPTVACEKAGLCPQSIIPVAVPSRKESQGVPHSPRRTTPPGALVLALFKSNQKTKVYISVSVHIQNCCKTDSCAWQCLPSHIQLGLQCEKVVPEAKWFTGR